MQVCMCVWFCGVGWRRVWPHGCSSRCDLSLSVKGCATHPEERRWGELCSTMERKESLLWGNWNVTSSFPSPCRVIWHITHSEKSLQKTLYRKWLGSGGVNIIFHVLKKWVPAQCELSSSSTSWFGKSSVSQSFLLQSNLNFLWKWQIYWSSCTIKSTSTQGKKQQNICTHSAS